MAKAVLSAETIERWQARWAEAKTDQTWVALAGRRTRGANDPTGGRCVVEYLAGKIDTSELRDTFDKRIGTRGRVRAQGVVGRHVLNKLVKYLPQPDLLTTQLRELVGLPDRWMRPAGKWTLSTRMSARRHQERPGLARRTPAWPPGILRDCMLAFAGQGGVAPLLRVRRADASAGWIVQRRGQADPRLLPVPRSSWASPTRRRRTGPWSTCWPAARPTRSSFPPPPPPPALARRRRPRRRYRPDGPGDRGSTGGTEERAHAHVSGCSAKIGQRVGCKVWIAANDQGKHGRERLGRSQPSDLAALGPR